MQPVSKSLSVSSGAVRRGIKKKSGCQNLPFVREMPVNTPNSLSTSSYMTCSLALHLHVPKPLPLNESTNPKEATATVLEDSNVTFFELNLSKISPELFSGWDCRAPQESQTTRPHSRIHSSILSTKTGPSGMTNPHRPHAI